MIRAKALCVDTVRAEALVSRLISSRKMLRAAAGMTSASAVAWALTSLIDRPTL